VPKKWEKQRDKIDNLIIPKLSTALSEEKKKKNKVTNYLSALRIEGKIVNKDISGKLFKHF
jgi:ATP-dependent DNA helicase RecG